MAENIKKLHQQIQERIEVKLQNNAEYQEKKKELEGMKEDWRKMGPGPGIRQGTEPGFKAGTQPGIKQRKEPAPYIHEQNKKQVK